MTNNFEQHVSENAYKNIQTWLHEPKYSGYVPELETLINDEQWHVLEDSFFKDIEFGTAGRRGIVGIGSNRINTVTVAESTQALCQYAQKHDANALQKGIVIACDTRLSSKELSRHVASTAAASGFKVYIFDSFRSTPELSFAVRHLNAAVGVVITASHNPSDYNGFKAYWSDGGPLVPPHDSGVLSEIHNTDTLNFIDFDQAVHEGAISIIDHDVDDAYISAAAAQAEGTSRNIKIVYSPLHGAGQTNTLPVLKRAGFDQISVVEAQMVPDGSFPTIPSGKSNPEEQAANAMAVEQMVREHADIAITNDPDADRIGVMLMHNGEPVYLSGNESAVLAAEFSLMKMKQKGTITPAHYLVKTIVTTDMLYAVAEYYHVKLYGNLLVGFKWIGEMLTQKEASGEIFVTGSEESFGLLKGDYARDKDGATGALPLAEYAAELKQDGKTLYDALVMLYQRHGVYREHLDNAQFEGAAGFSKMVDVMQSLRTDPPTDVAGHTVTATLDYETLQRTDLSTGDVSSIDCISGNVFVLELDGDIRKRITVRPSGTEPKMKLYIQWYEDAEADVPNQLTAIDHRIESLSNVLKKLLLE